MVKTAWKIFERLDDAIARVSVDYYQERNSLLVFFFHGVVDGGGEDAAEILASGQTFPLPMIREFIEYHLSNDYQFTRPSDIVQGGVRKARRILLTFDDGYYNNHLILPLLKTYNVHALLCVSVNYVLQRKPFWWNVIHREETKRRKTAAEILAIVESMNPCTHLEIESLLRKRYGRRAEEVVSDVDRPFTDDELRDIARDRHVTIGNHTMDHGILSNYDNAEIHTQIGAAQREIKGIIGYAPDAISYPHGYYSKDVIRIARDEGLRIGLTIEPKKNYPDGHTELMRLGRFALQKESSIREQCRRCRSDLSVGRLISNFVDKRY